MITNPIIPIWLMTIICVILLCTIFIDFNRLGKNGAAIRKANRPQNIIKYKRFNKISKLVIVVILFVLNLRFMIPNSDVTQINYDVDVLFVIDKSVSMRALDYNGENERMKGVIDDCCHIIDSITGAKYAIITFGNNAEKLVPFTSDADLVKAEMGAIITEDDFYADGTSINIVKNKIEEVLKSEQKRQGGDAKTIVFFISDGEITAENETVESFGSLKKYILGGAVMGYGTSAGGKMVSKLYENDPTSSSYYVYYYDKKYNKEIAVSKIDETVLNSLASDMGISYVHMENQSNIDSVLQGLQDKMVNLQTTEEKIDSYSDTYYYVASALMVCLIADFIVRKRSIG